MPEETRLFIRSFLFALVIAVVYWIVSSDYVGTILLGGFSVASLTLFSMLRRGQPTRSVPAEFGRGLLSRIGDLVGTTEHAGQEQPFEDESGRIPAGSGAPVLLGVGIALIGFGLIFGVWSMIAGAIPTLLGLRVWLREVSAEFRAVDAADDESRTGLERAATRGGA